MSSWRTSVRLALVLAAFACVATVTGLQTSPRFADDDPLLVEEDTEDASGARPRDLVFAYDMMLNLFGQPGDPTAGVRAQNANSIDEVPDSSWFTNRIGSRPLSSDDLVRGPDTGDGPATGTWTIVGPKSSGVTPGFTVVDVTGQRWFIEFDPPGAPEAPSGAEVVATKIFWALGYNQAENYISSLRPEQLKLDGTARMHTLSGRRRPMTQRDVDAILKRAARRTDGSYRVLASKALPGTPLGGFEYFGTRPDDPNDVIPHEHRRELRALKVFGAWTNFVDQKALNTLDMAVDRGGRTVVRHYLLDVGSTFGTGALGPHEWDEGWEYVVDLDGSRKRLFSVGLALSPWETVQYHSPRSIGRFEATAFDPRTWRPRVAHAAYLRARADDDFWAARRVAAFDDAAIRAVTRVGRYSDERAATHLADILIARRDKIAATYLTAINPLVDFALSSNGELSFVNAATAARVAAPPRRYLARWYRFDNQIASSELLGETAAEHSPIASPGPLTGDANAFVRVDVWADAGAHPSWSTPIQVYFRKNDNSWVLTGLERSVEKTAKNHHAGDMSPK